MDLRRLRPAEWLAGLGGVALIGTLFLPWYGAGDVTATGWESFRAVDLILAGLALVAIAVAVVSATQVTTALPIALASIAMSTGGIAVIFVLIRLANLPGAADGREIGVFLALPAAAVMAAGAYLCSRDERITGDTRTLDPADVQTLPAPQPGP